jgi:hypothetical protein
MWCQCGEGGESHVVATVADLRRIIVLRCSHNLRSRLPCRVTDRTLRVAVVFLVLGAPLVLDVVALALHDLVDTAWRTVVAIVVEVTSQLSLLMFAVMLVDVTAGITTTSLLVEVGT